MLKNKYQGQSKVFNAIAIGFAQAFIIYMGLKNSGGISNPGLAYVQINYVSYMYTANYSSEYESNPYKI